MKCFIDMDGVLVDFLAGAMRLHNKKFEDINHGAWDPKNSFNMSEEEFWAPVNADFWADLPPTPQCQQLFQLLADRFGMENLCILSAPPRVSKKLKGTMGHAVEGKYNWCLKHVPQIADQCLFGWSKDFAARDRAVLVDDTYRNISEFERAGGKGVMVEYYWNSGWKWQPGEHVVQGVVKQLDKIK